MEETKKHPIHLQSVDDAVKHFNYGDVISMEWLYDSFMIKLPAVGSAETFKEVSFKFLSCIEGMKEEMLEKHNMMLVSVRGEGYMICHPRDQTPLAMDKLKKKLRKEFRRADHCLTFINMRLLTDDQKKENTNAIAKLSFLRQMSNKTKLIEI